MKILKSFLKSFSLYFTLTLLFLFILFPFNDLSQLVSDQVSKATQNRIFVQFKNLSLSLFPAGVQMEQVYLETATGTQLKLEELIVRPSISGALKRQPFGFVEALGFMNGKAQIQILSGTQSEKGSERYKLEVKLEDLKLEELKNLINLPLVMHGQLSSQITAQASPLFNEQPESEFSLNVSNFKIPNSNVVLGALGALNVPEMKLRKIDGKGRLENASLMIDSLQIGQAGDDLSGSVKGQIALTVERIRDEFQKRELIIPRFGSYSFDVKLNATPDFEKRASFYFIFLSGYKTQVPGQYHFKVSGLNPQLPPNITALR